MHRPLSIIAGTIAVMMASGGLAPSFVCGQYYAPTNNSQPAYGYAPYDQAAAVPASHSVVVPNRFQGSARPFTNQYYPQAYQQQIPQYGQSATMPYLAMADNGATSGDSMSGASAPEDPASAGAESYSHPENGGANGCQSCGSGDACGCDAYGYGYGYGCDCGNDSGFLGLGGFSLGNLFGRNQYGCDNGYNSGCNSGCLSGCNSGCGRQWFGGVYGLYMERTHRGSQILAVDMPTPTDYPAYPMPEDTVMVTPDSDWQGGAEIRFGSTFGCPSQPMCNYDCSGCNTSCDSCYSSCGPTYAWEVAVWALDEQTDEFSVMPMDRLYGMPRFDGLEHSPTGDEADYMPVNEYYDNPMWDGPHDVIVNEFRTRRSFEMQNFELNLIRLPMATCAPCNCDPCGGGGSFLDNLSVASVCGFRYVRFEDEFMFSAYNDASTLSYESNVDNNLYGFQLGANMNYCVSCKCSLFCDSMFGVYGNHITQYRRMNARYVASEMPFAEDSSKDEISFLGETRLGAAYQVTCNCRLSLAWRVLAASGVANNDEPFPADFSNGATASHINSDGSIIVHGLQAGAEYKF